MDPVTWGFFQMPGTGSTPGKTGQGGSCPWHDRKDGSGVVCQMPVFLTGINMGDPWAAPSIMVIAVLLRR